MRLGWAGNMSLIIRMTPHFPTLYCLLFASFNVVLWLVHRDRDIPMQCQCSVFHTLFKTDKDRRKLLETWQPLYWFEIPTVYGNWHLSHSWHYQRTTCAALYVNSSHCIPVFCTVCDVIQSGQVQALSAEMWRKLTTSGFCRTSQHLILIISYFNTLPTFELELDFTFWFFYENNELLE